MATARIGFPADWHYPDNYSDSTFAEDIDHLYNTKGCDVVIHGGDQMGGSNGAPPHFQEQDLRDFWNLVDSNGDLSKTYATPGNHDIPVPYYERISREYIGARAATPQKIQPVDGVTCLIFSTVGPGGVQGGWSGVGQDYRYVPTREFDWLYSELQDAHSRGDIVLLFTHASLWFGQSSALTEYHPETPFSSLDEATMWTDQERQFYFVTNDFADVMDLLTDQSPVCVFHGDSAHPGTTGSSYEDYVNVLNADVYHTWQDHWANGGSSPTTTSYIDVDTSTGQVVYKTIQHSDKTETTVMDVSPAW